MSWWHNDDLVDAHYRRRYEEINGWDPLDPPEVEEEEDDYFEEED